MSARTVLDKAWNDSVWSKVIATGITAALAALLGSLAGYVDVPETLGGRILRGIDAPVTLPAWSLAALAFVIVALAVLLHRRGRSRPGAEEDIQPNAVPVVEAPIVACPSAPRRRRPSASAKREGRC